MDLMMHLKNMPSTFRFFCLFLLALALIGCERPDPDVTIVAPTANPTLMPATIDTASFQQIGVAPPEAAAPVATEPPTYEGVPTPDAPHDAGGVEDNAQVHIISPGETAGLYLSIVRGVAGRDLRCKPDAGD